MLHLAHSRRSALDRAHSPLSFMSHPVTFTTARDPLPDHLSQRSLGGGAARRRRWRLPGASQPVRSVRRTGRNLRRRCGGEIRRRPRGAGAQRRVFDHAVEAVTAAPARHRAGPDGANSDNDVWARRSRMTAPWRLAISTAVAKADRASSLFRRSSASKQAPRRR